MGLFTKKDPCAICGGKVKALFPSKVEKQLVCKACYGTVHLPKGMAETMTLEQFKQYRQFRQAGDALRQQFKTTQQISFGFFGEQFLFDTENKLFCPSVDLQNTIFEGKNIKSFVIREDNQVLYEGSAAGLICHESAVNDRIIALTPTITQVAMMKQLHRLADQVSDSDRSTSRYNQEIPKPFDQFLVEIRFDHPYWDILTADKVAPEFSTSDPSVDDYLCQYREDAALMEQLARALMAVAFPGAPEQRVSANAAAQTAAAPVDAVAEIQRFKELLDQGVITQEEFDAKKRQLLGL